MGHRERAESRRECIREQRTPGPERPRLVAREPGAHRAARRLARLGKRCAEQGRKRARGQEQQRNREAQSRGRRRESPAGQKPRADHGHDRDQQIGASPTLSNRPDGDRTRRRGRRGCDAARAPQRIARRVAPQRDRCEDATPSRPRPAASRTNALDGAPRSARLAADRVRSDLAMVVAAHRIHPPGSARQPQGRRAPEASMPLPSHARAREPCGDFRRTRRDSSSLQTAFDQIPRAHRLDARAQ
jgi:hypothetical protein